MCFGPFTFDVATCRIARDGVEIHLTPKAAAVLCHLLQHPGELVTKDEFLEVVWEGVHVREESLTQAISVIRQALGDSAQSPLYIQTVSGEGYRFIGELSAGEYPAATGSDASGPGSRASRAPGIPSPGSRIRRLSREVLATAAVVVIAIGGLAWLWRPASPDLEAAPDFTTVTSYAGYENYPALSPDGQQVAFLWNDGGVVRLYVKFVSGSEPSAIAEARLGDPAWRPDGERIAYMRYHESPDGGAPTGLEIVTITPHGTDERIEWITSTTRAGLDWSPDGGFLAFSDRPGPGEGPSIFFLSLETGNAHQVTFRPEGEATLDNAPSFSPDGRHLAFIRERGGSGGGGSVYVQDLDEEGQPLGEPRPLPSPDVFFLWDLDWTSDSKAVVYSGSQTDDNRFLSKVSIEGGDPTRLALGDNVRDFSIVGDRLLYSQRQDNIDIWRIGGPTAAVSGEPELWQSSTRDDHFPHYSPDGRRVAFISGRSGAWEVWIADAGGGNPRQLSHLGHATRPRWAPDNSLIAFNSSAGTTDRMDVYVVNPDVGAPINLTPDEFSDSLPGWSADSQWIYFQSRRHGGRTWEIWRMSREGRDLTQITEGGDFRPLHHDGLLYVFRTRAVLGGPSRIVRLPDQGGPAEIVVDHFIENDGFDLWRGSLVFIEYSNPGEAVISIVDLESREIRQHAVVPVQGTGWVRPEGTLTVSPDGKYILYSAKAGPGGADLILVENFR